MKKISLLSLVALLSTQVFTAPVSYVVDVKNSSVNWIGKKTIGIEHNGTINILEGSVVQNGKSFSGKIVIDMNSIVDLDLKSKKDKTDLVNHLKSDDFFQVAKFPTAQLDIVSVKQIKDTDYTVVANFTILDQKQKITFPAKINFVENCFDAEGTVEIDRTKFNLKYGSKSFFKELVAERIISDMFTLTFKIKSVK